MPKVLGIIAEYDPFHLGHEYHLKEALKKTEADVAIAAISGNFTQRGEPAIVDKWARAEMALKAGFDLVVEMPFIFACNNAGYFAQSGVSILEALGADYIAFGSETADVEALLEAADARKNLSAEQHQDIKSLVKEGMSYPRALTMVLGDEKAYGPNDNLAVEYLRHMETAKPVPILRKGAGHGDLLEEEGLASATMIRKDLLKYGDMARVKALIPEDTAEILIRERAGHEYVGPEDMLPFIMARVASLDGAELDEIYGAEEGLGRKLKEEFRYADSYEKLVEALKSKRYTRTRIQRVLIHTLMNTRREDVLEGRNYIRVLGFREKGAEHLKNLKKQDGPGLPVIDNIKKDLSIHPELKTTVGFDIKASDMYNTMFGRDLYLNSEYVKKPLKL